MAYKYENDVISELEQMGVDYESNGYFNMSIEVEEVYRKARAYDLLKEDLLINEKVFREQAENDEVSDIIHGHYVALLVQAELERADDERRNWSNSN